MTEHMTILDRARGCSLRLPLQAAPIDRTLPPGALTCDSGINPSIVASPLSDWDDYFPRPITTPFIGPSLYI
jgi:hypothetical protein